MKMLPETYVWARKIPLNFGSDQDLDVDQIRLCFSLLLLFVLSIVYIARVMIIWQQLKTVLCRWSCTKCCV